MSKLITPGCTRATRLGRSTSRIFFIRDSPITMQPADGSAPPDKPVPAPRGTTGIPSSRDSFTHAATSSVEPGSTTISGRTR